MRRPEVLARLSFLFSVAVDWVIAVALACLAFTATFRAGFLVGAARLGSIKEASFTFLNCLITSTLVLTIAWPGKATILNLAQPSLVSDQKCSDLHLQAPQQS